MDTTVQLEKAHQFFSAIPSFERPLQGLGPAINCGQKTGRTDWGDDKGSFRRGKLRNGRGKCFRDSFASRLRKSSRGNMLSSWYSRMPRFGVCRARPFSLAAKVALVKFSKIVLNRASFEPAWDTGEGASDRGRFPSRPRRTLLTLHRPFAELRFSCFSAFSWIILRDYVQKPAAVLYWPTGYQP